MRGKKLKFIKKIDFGSSFIWINIIIIQLKGVNKVLARKVPKPCPNFSEYACMIVYFEYYQIDLVLKSSSIANDVEEVKLWFFKLFP